MKVQRSLKEAAKKNQKDVCAILAKEIIRSRKAVSKIYASKAQLNSVEMSMKNQLGKYFLVRPRHSIMSFVWECTIHQGLISEPDPRIRYYFWF